MRCIIGLLLLCGTLPAAAQESVLSRAWSLYHQGQQDQALQRVRELLPRLERPADLRDAYLLLGACAYLRGDGWAAEDQLITALSYDLTYRPDPLRFSPDLRALLARVARERRPEIERRVKQRRVTSLPVVTPPRERGRPPEIRGPKPVETMPARGPASAKPTPVLLAVLPFGGGQFANGQRAKGFLFLGLEGTLLVTSVSCLGGALALRDSEGKYRASNIEAARALNVVYLATGYAALGLTVYGVIDGLTHRKPREGRVTWVGPGPFATLGAGVIHVF